MIAGGFTPQPRESLTRYEYKSLKVEVDIIMPWIYGALFFIEPQASLGIV